MRQNLVIHPRNLKKKILRQGAIYQLASVESTEWASFKTQHPYLTSPYMDETSLGLSFP